MAAQTISDANATGQYGGMLGGAGSGGTYAGGAGNASPYQPSADNQTSQTASTTGNGAVINNSASAKTAMGGGSGGGGSGGGGGGGGGAGGYSLGASMADSTTQSLGFSGSLGSNRVSGAVFGDFNNASGGGTATQGISSRTLMILGIVGAVVAGVVALAFFGRRR